MSGSPLRPKPRTRSWLAAILCYIRQGPSGGPTQQGRLNGKDHPIPQCLIIEDTPNIVEHDNDSEDEEEQAKAKPNPDTYKPPVPYPQALNCLKANTNESDDHLLEAFKKVTITIPLIDAIKHITSYAKFLKDICIPDEAFCAVIKTHKRR